ISHSAARKKVTQKMIPDQKAVWDRKHGADEHAGFRDTPNPFVVLVNSRLSSPSRILELGCGVGSSASYLAKNGHKVTATDISDVVIEQDKRHFADLDIDFSVLNMQKPFPSADASF